MSRLWDEYSKTLHPQTIQGANGINTISCWRATALAENFFTEQVLVDSRLKTEYFKHIPGILTGLGIIGTFIGLIIGLTNFNIPSDLTKVQDELRQLIDSVGHAFIVSAISISLAMLFTWYEKKLVSRLYCKVEKIRELIDRMFKAGAGEEYLERLVIAAETSATQAAHIKDAIVADLKEILTSLATQQIEAQVVSTAQMSAEIGKSISASLGPSMDAITKAVQGVSANQGEAVNQMLTDVLLTFSTQMREMFGGQMTGMSDLLRETSESMRTTATQFGQLAANMNIAGKNTVDSMGEKLVTALDNMDIRQKVMNDNMVNFVDQIRNLVSESQTESARKLQESLVQISNQVSTMVASLQAQSEAAANAQGYRQQQFVSTTSEVIGTLSQQMEKLLAQSVQTNQSLQETVSKLAVATDTSISKLNSGAELLAVAAKNFAVAGDGVADTINASTNAVNAIKGASGQLVLATENAKNLFADYGRSSSVFTHMVTELKSTIENASKDAAMTSELVNQLKAASAQLNVAQQESEVYLQGVTDVLSKAHKAFAENIERTLGTGNRQFHAELTTSVGLLSAAIQNLGDLVDAIPQG